MITISREQIIDALDYPSLIGKLKEAFQGNYTVPMRHHHDYKNPVEGRESTLLLMPAWEAGNYLGVKLVTVSPNNGKYDMPSIQGIYMLFDAHKGAPLAQMEAKALTARRTAAASALASSFLSREDSESLLMIGTGALSAEIIEAHCTVRPIKKVLVWGRSEAKAQAVIDELKRRGLTQTFEVVATIEEGVKQVDIISSATLSQEPLIKGEWLTEGQHIDLIGAYRPDMREADNDCVLKSSVFVDTYAGATKECGDLAIPLKEGIIQREDIKAELFELCKEEKQGRQNSEEITFFKSVGHALEDLAAAQLVAEKVGIQK